MISTFLSPFPLRFCPLFLLPPSPLSPLSIFQSSLSPLNYTPFPAHYRYILSPPPLHPILFQSCLSFPLKLYPFPTPNYRYVYCIFYPLFQSCHPFPLRLYPLLPMIDILYPPPPPPPPPLPYLPLSHFSSRAGPIVRPINDPNLLPFLL